MNDFAKSQLMKYGWKEGMLLEIISLYNKIIYNLIYLYYILRIYYISIFIIKLMYLINLYNLKDIYICLYN